MSATISKYKTVVIVILMLISLLITWRLDGQVGFHLVGEVLCNENIEKEKTKHSQKIKQADKKNPKKGNYSKGMEQVTDKLITRDSTHLKVEESFCASEVKFKNEREEKHKISKNGI
jgi:hypothetical protein